MFKTVRKGTCARKLLKISNIRILLLIPGTENFVFGYGGICGEVRAGLLQGTAGLHSGTERRRSKLAPVPGIKRSGRACRTWKQVHLERYMMEVDVTIIVMRTTLNLPDDVTRIVRAFADARGVSLGDAVAELVRLGLRSEVRIGEDAGIPCFTVPQDAAPITLEHTLSVEDEP
jgi:hypothetical protein